MIGDGMTSLRDRLRLSKMYRPVEAARIVGTSASNVRRWFLGYTDRTGKMKPVLGKKALDEFRLSFMNLCELVVVSGFRKEGIKLDVIRRAHTYTRNQFNLSYPFASLELKKHGANILHEFEKGEGVEQGLVVSLDGQITLPGFVKAQIVHFDFDNLDNLAFRWFPYGREICVVVDPRFGSGLPTVSGRNLRIEILVRRFHGGQDIQSLVDDFQLSMTQVEEVLKHAA